MLSIFSTLRTDNVMPQAKAAWESLIDASSDDSAIIEVQNWYVQGVL